jgi:hyperosmotically inducible protein
MKMLVAFLAGVLVGVVGQWYFTQPQSGTKLAEAEDALRTGVTNLGRSVKETLSAESVKEEMARAGKVIREKTRKAGDAIADAAANARITATIKTKLIQDSGLSAFKIDVDTTDGVVTLSGTVPTHEEIARAITLAWETDGVIKVISTIQVKPK